MIHNQLTNYAKLLAGFRRSLGEMGVDFAGIERAGETLTPTMDLWALPEWALLRGEVIFSRTAGVSGGAATFGSIELVNPTGSGVLAVVLEIVNISARSGVAVDTGPALGATATTQGVANDTRFPNLGATSRCTVVTGALAATVSLAQDDLAVGKTSTRPYIIIPGKKLFIINLAVNVGCEASLLWTERPLLPGEGDIR